MITFKKNVSKKRLKRLSSSAAARHKKNFFPFAMIRVFRQIYSVRISFLFSTITSQINFATAAGCFHRLHLGVFKWKTLTTANKNARTNTSRTINFHSKSLNFNLLSSCFPFACSPLQRFIIPWANRASDLGRKKLAKLSICFEFRS